MSLETAFEFEKKLEELIHQTSRDGDLTTGEAVGILFMKATQLSNGASKLNSLSGSN